VPGERRARILAQLLAAEDAELGTTQLCRVCADVTGVTGAGIMLLSGDVVGVSLSATNAVSTRIEELQYTLGEGPCLDAYHQGRAVLEPDLADPTTPRWVGFAGAAVEAGVRAIFGFPLEVGVVRLGALNLYCDRPGPLTGDQHADGLVMADVAAHAVLVMQAEAPPGTLAGELQAGADLQAVVHQASGMVSAQLEVSVGQALIRLRAYAYGNNLRLAEVAEGVVSRWVRFSDVGEHTPRP
jgi:GAF domain-containing protein